MGKRSEKRLRRGFVYCDLPFCGWDIPTGRRLCPRHWEQLPPEMQEGVRTAWNNGEPLPEYAAVIAFTNAWLTARHEAGKKQYHEALARKEARRKAGLPPKKSRASPKEMTMQRKMAAAFAGELPGKGPKTPAPVDHNTIG